MSAQARNATSARTSLEWGRRTRCQATCFQRRPPRHALIGSCGVPSNPSRALCHLAHGEDERHADRVGTEDATIRGVRGVERGSASPWQSGSSRKRAACQGTHVVVMCDFVMPLMRRRCVVAHAAVLTHTCAMRECGRGHARACVCDGARRDGGRAWQHRGHVRLGREAHCLTRWPALRLVKRQQK